MQSFYTKERCEADQEAILDNLDKIDLDVITDSRRRYDIFKEYNARFYYCDKLREYAEEADGEDDISSIAHSMLEIERVRNHPFLRIPGYRETLYKEGVQLINNVKQWDLAFENYPEEDLKLMLFVLHERAYFNDYPLPETFFVCGSARYDQVGIVYAKYFLFYYYLEGKLKELHPDYVEMEVAKKHRPVKKPNTPILSFRDLFKTNHKDKFEQIMSLLSEEMPARVRNKYGMLDLPFIIISDEGEISWNPRIRTAISYVTGIYHASSRWLDHNISAENVNQALSNTFGIDIKSRAASRKATAVDSTFDEKYIEPFELLFSEIK